MAKRAETECEHERDSDGLRLGNAHRLAVYNTGDRVQGSGLGGRNKLAVYNTGARDMHYLLERIQLTRYWSTTRVHTTCSVLYNTPSVTISLKHS